MGCVSAALEGNRLIIVTGASGGIGRALVSQLAGVDSVIGTYNKSKCPERGNDKGVEFEKVDLSDEASIRDFVDKLKPGMKHITVVHCAAKSINKLMVRFDAQDWDDVLDVNLRGNFLLNKALIPLMIRDNWGRIIHISSVVGMNGTPGTAAYASSKTGLIGLSRVLAKEYARFGVTSNVLCLGYFEVGLIESLDEGAREEIRLRIPSRNFGKVSDIANAVRWVMQAEYLNGAQINMDGGL